MAEIEGVERERTERTMAKVENQITDRVPMVTCI